MLCRSHSVSFLTLAVMELFVFIAFQLLVEVQSYKSPTVKVSPDVIRESSSVKISCETPADVTVNQCYFITNREEKNIKVSSSCELDLSGAEVLGWAAVKSPESIYINCYYTIHEQGFNKPSSHSPPATVTVLDSLQKPFIRVSGDNNILSCEIPLSVRADFICSLYTEDDDLLYQRVSQRSQSGGSQCMFYLSHSELFTRSVNSRHLICVYSLKTQPEIRSPHSDTYTIRGLPQAKLRASASVIVETDTVELSCEDTEDLKMEKCVFIINGRESNSKRSSSCQLSLTGSQISVWSGGQSSSVRITCLYTVVKGQVSVPSPHSDPVTVTVKISTATSTGKTLTTATKTTSVTTSNGETSTAPTNASASTLPDSTRETETSVPQTVHTHSDDSWLSVVLVFTGIGLFLSGLIGFICLCGSTSSADVLTELNYTSCQLETTSLLTSSVCSSKHG
ncbi:uncharacterized protein LOC131549582 isoform X2 [Onychostoma macrolepis]|uniref:uncharacterized protein LOC131549582 isoform X2 n=1 Tax=Onychostoma macrolepis TaxID=369639 RepID=UPI00272B56D1|nr:uncharacterized protein LOC131549582 isoform X2 [Onychostoma macrolepis]